MFFQYNPSQQRKTCAMVLVSLFTLVSCGQKSSGDTQSTRASGKLAPALSSFASETQTHSPLDSSSRKIKLKLNVTKGGAKSKSRVDHDARTLARLARLGNDITNQQLAHINQLLATHHDDPYFAEQAVTTLGAKGTLTFWQSADRSANSNNRKKILTNIQKNLGHTLATATHSDSKGIEDWKKDIIALGPHQFPGTDPDNPRRGYGPYGFQIMSSLMRNGKYEENFLWAYGKKLISFEQHHAHGDAQKLWMPESMQASLNYTGTDRGNDPMAGYLEALGRTPQAAKKLFHSLSVDVVDPRDHDPYVNTILAYLILDRDWFMDPASASNASTSSGAEEFGHALEAATLGRPGNKPRSGIRRDETTANVMDQVVALVGRDQDLLSNLPQLARSLATIGAGYIDDFNWGRAGFSDTSRNSYIQREGTGHFDPGSIETSDFLSMVGATVEGHSILSAAQRQYTLSMLPESGDESTASRYCLVAYRMHATLDVTRLARIKENNQEEEVVAESRRSSAWTEYTASSHDASTGSLLSVPIDRSDASTSVRFSVPEPKNGNRPEFRKSLSKQIALKNESREGNIKEMSAKDFLNFGEYQAQLPTVAYEEVLEANNTEVSWSNEVFYYMSGAYRQEMQSLLKSHS